MLPPIPFLRIVSSLPVSHVYPLVTENNPVKSALPPFPLVLGLNSGCKVASRALYPLSHLAGPRWGFIKIFNTGLSMRVEKETDTHRAWGVISEESQKDT